MLTAVVVAYAAAFSWWSVRNFEGFGTFGFDLGIFDQGIWLLSRFHVPFVTFMGRNLFGDHTSFILLPFVPLYWLYPSAKLLLVAQSIAMALTAVPIFLIAKRRLGDEWLALVLACAVLLQPALQWTNLEQFHPDMFEVPLTAMVLLFMLEERWTPYFISLAALMSVKEDTPLLVLGLGVYVALTRNRKIGLITCGCAIGYGVIAVLGILRALNGVGSLNQWRIPFGGTGGLFRTVFAHPVRFWNYLTSEQRPWYVWQLVSPFALIPILGLDIALIAVLPLTANLVSNFPYQHQIHFHYTTTIVPTLAVASVVGISRLRWEFARYLAVGSVGAAALLSAYIWGPTQWAAHPQPLADPDSPVVRAVERATANIPADASISAFYGFAVYLDHRREIYNFPVPWHAQYWGVFKQEGQRLPQAANVDYLVVPPDLGNDTTAQQVFASIRDQFRIVVRSRYVLVLKRVAPG